MQRQIKNINLHHIYNCAVIYMCVIMSHFDKQARIKITEYATTL